MASTGADSGVVEFLVVAALERYQASWDQLIAGWFDRDCCRRVNDELDELRKLAASLPHLAADMMEVIMRHAQLLRALMRSQTPAVDQVSALRGKHRAAVDVVRGKCVQVLATRR